MVDVGGTNVTFLATGPAEPRRFPSGPGMIPAQMVERTKAETADRQYDAIAMGYPGFVRRGQIALEPYNLSPGWVGFDMAAAIGCSVRILNDAAMQAVGGYEGGFLLVVGLGTGLGSALVDEGVIVPMELRHLSYRQGEREDYVGARGWSAWGKKRWQRQVEALMKRLIEAFHPDEVVLGGGNARRRRWAAASEAMPTLSPAVFACGPLPAFRNARLKRAAA